MLRCFQSSLPKYLVFVVAGRARTLEPFAEHELLLAMLTSRAAERRKLKKVRVGCTVTCSRWDRSNHDFIVHCR